MSSTEAPSTFLRKHVRLRFFALFIVLVGAAWLRMRHLGTLALMGDEGIQALAVQGILQHGVPKLESGIIYSRAPLFLYLQAAIAYLFDTTAYWLRLPSVFWGTASIVPAYILGRKLCNRTVGMISAAVLTLSLWEIELSRYARFYTMFQFFFVVALICFYRGFMVGERRYRIWFLVASVFALSAHQGGKVLGILFLIPILSPAIPTSRKLIYGAWTVAFGLVLLLYREGIGLLHLWQGDVQPIPSGETTTGTIEQITNLVGLPPLKLPEFGPFIRVAEQHSLLLSAFAIIAVGATAFLGYRLARGEDAPRALLAGLSIWAALFHQFGVALILGVVYVGAFARSRRVFEETAFRTAIAAGIGFALGWFGVMMGVLHLSLRDTIDALLGFPNVLGYFLKWFVRGWPVMTGLLAIGSVLLFVRFLRNRKDDRAFFLLGALYLPMLFSSLFALQAESRYAFHLYPLIVLISVVPVYEAGRFLVCRLGIHNHAFVRLAVGVASIALFLSSQDVSPAHAWEVGSRTYKTTKDPFRSVVSWSHYARYHPDRKSPSLHVRRHMKPEDTVIVLGPAYMVALYEYYVGRVDYVVAPAPGPAIRATDPAHYGRVREEEVVHYVNGSELIFGLSHLKSCVQEGKARGRVWILGDHPLLGGSNNFYPEGIKKYVVSISNNEKFLGKDSSTFAVKAN